MKTRDRGRKRMFKGIERKLKHPDKINQNSEVAAKFEGRKLGKSKRVKPQNKVPNRWKYKVKE